MDPFEKPAPSGNCYVNLAVAAMFGDGWMVSVAEACIVYSRMTEIFVATPLKLHFSNLVIQQCVMRRNS